MSNNSHFKEHSTHEWTPIIFSHSCFYNGSLHRSILYHLMTNILAKLRKNAFVHFTSTVVDSLYLPLISCDLPQFWDINSRLCCGNVAELSPFVRRFPQKLIKQVQVQVLGPAHTYTTLRHNLLSTVKYDMFSHD